MKGKHQKRVRVVENDPRADPQSYGGILGHCDAGSACQGKWRVEAQAGDGYTVRTMRLCEEHLIDMANEMTDLMLAIGEIDTIDSD